MNLVVLIGRLGRDPEGATTQSGASVAKLTIATSERWKDRNTGEKRERAEWHRVVAWNHSADYATRYLRKGRLVRVTGKLETRKWQDKNGQDRYTTEIKADVVEGLDKMDEAQTNDQAAQAGNQNNTQRYQSGNSMSGAAGWGDQQLDDEVPF